MARAMNSDESSNSRMKALACLSTRGRNHLRGELVAEQEDRQPVVAAALGRQHLFQDLPLRRLGLGAVDRHQPARFGVEDIDQAPGILVAETGHHAKAFLLDRGSQLPHAAPGGVLAFVVFVDDCDRKRLH